MAEVTLKVLVKVLENETVTVKRTLIVKRKLKFKGTVAVQVIGTIMDEGTVTVTVTLMNKNAGQRNGHDSKK